MGLIPWRSVAMGSFGIVKGAAAVSILRARVLLTCGIKHVGNTPTASYPQWQTALGHHIAEGGASSDHSKKMRGAFHGRSRAAFFGYIRDINARQDKSSLKRTEPLQDLGVVKPADGRIAGVGESPRADVMRLPRHLLRTADRGLGTQALNCIVGKDGAVITPRYRRCKVVDHAFAHSSLSLICGEQQKGHRRVRRSATAYHVGMIRNP
jgi:hypothetical protein